VAGKRVGVLGGSFNPAHDGHRHVSILALKRLELDEVWWMVAPQNPLKSADEMAPLEKRLDAAKIIATHPRIRVTDIERDLGTKYTADTVVALKRRFSNFRFVWLMGADNLIQIPQWQDWQKIFEVVPIAIFTRPSYSSKALFGQAARRFAAFRVAESRAGSLIGMQPPAWVFLHTRPHSSSATQIRARRVANRAAGERDRGR
jgi:nicotinate-nucleotide adenylyltransferase